jgi:hypothetical protein
MTDTEVSPLWGSIKQDNGFLLVGNCSNEHEQKRFSNETKWYKIEPRPKN